MATKIYRRTGTAQTVGAVTGDVVTFTLTADTSIVIQAYLTGNNATTDSASFAIIGGAKRTGAGGAAIIGAIVGALGVVDAVVAGTTATIVASGNTVILRPTGVALQTIDWFGELLIWET